MKDLSPEKLFLIIVIGVAVGIGLSPHIGTIGIVFGVLALIVVVASLSFKILKIALQHLFELPNLLKSEIILYKRSFINAWIMLTSRNSPSIIVRLEGLWVFITFLAWLMVIAILITFLVTVLIKS